MFSRLYYSAHDPSSNTINWTHISYHQMNTSQVIIVMSTQYFSRLIGPLNLKLCAHCILKKTHELNGNSSLLMFLNDDFSECMVSSASHCVSTIVDFQWKRVEQYHQLNLNQLCYWTYINHIFLCSTALLLGILNSSINWTYISSFLLIPSTVHLFKGPAGEHTHMSVCVCVMWRNG
jgi:hypothetical protein